MNPLNVIQDSLYFFRRNLGSILVLCLPLVVLEALAKQALSNSLGANATFAYELLIALLFYPLYTGALILFLDARTRGETPQTRDLLAMALRLWPTFAVLSAISTLLILFGLSLFVLPGLWVMIKLAFSEYLLVLRKLTPFMAMRESMHMTNGHFVRILLCVLSVYMPLYFLEGVGLYLFPDPQGPAVSLLLDSLGSFLQLLTSIVMFRLFMLISEPENKA
ncbi:putative Membrane protein [Pseudomonas cichorii]|uniref:Putative Membrane protein n=1 Tax=Pseudomonas cichorii TaxID=36746 RepID=A0A3M4LIE6_PSECI|nr:YciC family protein [Pseudomonas cichorii]RMQ41256.1 putative Membrane protein [Pseudomonas cichorii]